MTDKCQNHSVQTAETVTTGQKLFWHFMTKPGWMESEKRAPVIKMQDKMKAKTVPTADLSLLIFLSWKNEDYISFISCDNFSDIRQIKKKQLLWFQSPIIRH